MRIAILALALSAAGCFDLSELEGGSDGGLVAYDLSKLPPRDQAMIRDGGALDIAMAGAADGALVDAAGQPGNDLSVPDLGAADLAKTGDMQKPLPDLAPECNIDVQCGGKPGVRCCNNHCIDTRNDPNNCSACGFVCNLNNANSACVNSTCMITSCLNGFGDCNNTDADGCETSLSMDVNNCGSCGFVCTFVHGSAQCAGGCFLVSCDKGWGNCDNLMMNGCETNVLNGDPMNCGKCNQRCTLNGVFLAGCSNANCTIISCLQPFADCDGVAATGCEVNINQDASNCGMCGKVCSLPHANQVCGNGMCVIGGCLPGYMDCNAQAGDGCEINIFTDTKHCGSCAQTNCNACNNGVCS
jgi:hypothetical protein